MRLLLFIFGWGLVTLGGYLFCAMGAWEVNPGAWDPLARLVWAILSFLGFVVFGFLALVISHGKQR